MLRECADIILKVTTSWTLVFTLLFSPLSFAGEKAIPPPPPAETTAPPVAPGDQTAAVKGEPKPGQRTPKAYKFPDLRGRFAKLAARKAKNDPVYKDRVTASMYKYVLDKMGKDVAHKYRGRRPNPKSRTSKVTKRLGVTAAQIMAVPVLGPGVAIAGKGIAKSASAVTQQGQAIIMIMVTAFAANLKESYELRGIALKDVPPGELMRAINDTVSQTLDSGEFQAGFLGGMFGGLLGAKPMQILQSILAKSEARQIFKTMISSWVHSLIMFVGWELTAELYLQAVELIEDEANPEQAAKDRLRAMADGGRMIWKSIGNVFKGGQLPADDKRILTLVFHNMWQIVIQDHELRNFWLLTTWRNHIATGEFVTNVTLLAGVTVAGGALGTVMFPGAGTLTVGAVAFFFGLVGGVLTLFVPEYVYGSINRFIEAASLRIRRAKINRIDHVTLKHRTDFLERLMSALETYDPNRNRLVYPKVGSSYDGYVTVLFGRLFRFYSNWNVADAKLETSKKSDPKDTAEIKAQRAKNVAEFQAESDKWKAKIETALGDLSQVYEVQYQGFVEFVKRTSMEKFFTDTEMENTPALYEAYFDMQETTLLYEFFRDFAETGKTNLKDETFQSTINRFYVGAFSRKALLDDIYASIRAAEADMSAQGFDEEFLDEELAPPTVQPGEDSLKATGEVN